MTDSDYPAMIQYDVGLAPVPGQRGALRPSGRIASSRKAAGSPTPTPHVNDAVWPAAFVRPTPIVGTPPPSLGGKLRYWAWAGNPANVSQAGIETPANMVTDGGSTPISNELTVAALPDANNDYPGSTWAVGTIDATGSSAAATEMFVVIVRDSFASTNRSYVDDARSLIGLIGVYPLSAIDSVRTPGVFSWSSLSGVPFATTKSARAVAYGLHASIDSSSLEVRETAYRPDGTVSAPFPMTLCWADFSEWYAVFTGASQIVAYFGALSAAEKLTIQEWMTTSVPGATVGVDSMPIDLIEATEPASVTLAWDAAYGPATVARNGRILATGATTPWVDPEVEPERSGSVEYNVQTATAIGTALLMSDPRDVEGTTYAQRVNRRNYRRFRDRNVPEKHRWLADVAALRSGLSLDEATDPTELAWTVLDIVVARTAEVVAARDFVGATGTGQVVGQVVDELVTLTGTADAPTKPYSSKEGGTRHDGVETLWRHVDHWTEALTKATAERDIRKAKHAELHLRHLQNLGQHLIDMRTGLPLKPSGKD